MFNLILGSRTKALIIPTSIPQHGISEKAAFHLLKNTDLLLNDVISNGTLTPAELAKFPSDATIQIVRSSLTIENIDFYREEIDYNAIKTLFKPINLQHRKIKISKNLIFSIFV